MIITFSLSADDTSVDRAFSDQQAPIKEKYQPDY